MKIYRSVYFILKLIAFNLMKLAVALLILGLG